MLLICFHDNPKQIRYDWMWWLLGRWSCGDVINKAIVSITGFEGGRNCFEKGAMFRYYRNHIGGIDCLPLHYGCFIKLGESPHWQYKVVKFSGATSDLEGFNLHGAAIGWIKEPLYFGSGFLVFGGGNHIRARGDLFFVEVGVDSHILVQKVETFSKATDRLTGKPLTPCPRAGLKGFVFDSAFYFFGGRDGKARCHNDMWSCRRIQNRYEFALVGFSGTPPTPRMWYSAALVGQRWMVWGGGPWVFSDAEIDLRDAKMIHIFDASLLAWSSISTSGNIPFLNLGSEMVRAGNQLWVFGGTRPYLKRDSTEVEALYDSLGKPKVLNMDTWHWQSPELQEGRALKPFRSNSNHHRSGIGACYLPVRKQFFLFGGARYFFGLYFHDLHTISWKEEVNTDKLSYVDWKCGAGVMGRIFRLYVDNLLNDEFRQEFLKQIFQRFFSKEAQAERPSWLPLPDFYSLDIHLPLELFSEQS